MDYFEIFPWDKNFETGIDIVDQQHRKLVDILNWLAAHLANCSNLTTLNDIFAELAAYADYHFKTEEQIWAQYLPQDETYLAHQHTHKKFIDQVLALKQQENQQPFEEVIQNIVSFLSHWLAFHILDTDKRMAKVVQAIQQGHSIETAKQHADNEMSGSMQVLIQTVLKMYDSLSVRSMDLMREKNLRRKAEQDLLRSEARWQFILESNGENVWDWHIQSGQIDYSATEIANIIGLKNHHKKENVSLHPDDFATVKQKIKRHFDGKSDFFTVKYRVLRQNGSWFWLLSRGKVVSWDAQGRPQRMVGTQSDITERELAKLIYQHSSQAMFVTDINNDIISINPAFTHITGYQESDVIGKNPRVMASGYHDKPFYQQLWLSLQQIGEWHGEVWNKRKNGEMYPQMLNINAVTNKEGQIDHYIALFSDISEKKRAEALILEQAYFDALTKLPNRRMFQQRLQHEIHRSQRSHHPFALLYIDLDHFKDVNDTLGHEVGDQLLVEVAQRILCVVRQTDNVSRLGGDEFTVIISQLRGAFTLGIERVAHKILQVLRQPFQLDVSQIYISASIGITLYPDDALDATDLLKNADQAMYLSKQNGRNGFNYFTPSMQKIAQKRQRLLNDLHDAIKHAQFEIYYQPIVNLHSGKIEKAEALIRWQHPQKGQIQPDDFIRLAEDSGLILDIGHWIYQTISQQLKRWQSHFKHQIQLSINVSPLQFKAENNIDALLTCLAQANIPPERCVVEITEGLLVETEPQVEKQLLQLEQAGIEVALDDFGTGYSSLAYIKKFHVDYIKIDKSFVDDLPNDEQNQVLCEAIIVMAKKMNMRVIAEGIETQAQQDMLQAMGCDYAQGYYHAKPLAVNEFEQLLTCL